MLRKDAVVTGAGRRLPGAGDGCVRLRRSSLIDALILRPLPGRRSRDGWSISLRKTPSHRGSRGDPRGSATRRSISLQEAASGRRGAVRSELPGAAGVLDLASLTAPTKGSDAQARVGQRVSRAGPGPGAWPVARALRRQCAGRASRGRDQRRRSGPVASAATAGSSGQLDHHRTRARADRRCRSARIHRCDARYPHRSVGAHDDVPRRGADQRRLAVAADPGPDGPRFRCHIDSRGACSRLSRPSGASGPVRFRRRRHETWFGGDIEAPLIVASACQRAIRDPNRI